MYDAIIWVQLKQIFLERLSSIWFLNLEKFKDVKIEKIMILLIWVISARMLLTPINKER